MKTKTEIQREREFGRLAWILVLVSMILFPLNGFGQNLSSIAVSNIDTKNIQIFPHEMGNLVRLELEKKEMFNIIDRYDMSDILKSQGLELTDCYGKSCIIELGKALNVDKVLTGSVERYSEKIVFTLRLINVETGMIEKTNVTEYQNIMEELQFMTEISVNNILGLANNPNIVELLVSFEEPITSKYISHRLSGPRMGVAFLTGDLALSIETPIDEGGYDGYPLFSQFGYQQEIQYLSAGNFNALVEFLVMVSGMEQQLFIPSLIFMNGFRFGKGNWEIAFGPTLSLRKEATGFYDEFGYLGEENDWYLDEEWTDPDQPNPYPLVERMDSRGDVGYNTGWVWAVGKSF
ncbi:MAG: penicillin-binding protein activator LpoB, partial [Anaerolineaceae bacterium]|nr:penicillin-binding protein activator LpoB [Anaerolineaceae bacterium]